MNLEATPQKPELVFRVGITGARCLRADQVERITQELSEILALVEKTLCELRGNERVAMFYKSPEPGKSRSMVRVITPLAKGADRLAAKAAYGLGMPIDVPMPFIDTVYQDDFKGKEAKCPEELDLTAEEDLEEFKALLAGCSGKVMLDGSRNDSRWAGGDLFEGQSYEAVGHYVVRHCDLLLAVWNGGASGGKGGTQEVIEYAARNGVPVWWIHTAPGHLPLWIADRLGLRGQPNPHVSADDSLIQHLTRLIPAPGVPLHETPTMLVRLAKWRQGTQPSPAAEYFKQPMMPQRAIFKSYKTMMDLVLMGKKYKGAEWTPPQTPASEAPLYWHNAYREADSRAGDFTPRYRSSYLIVIILAAGALITGGLAALAEHPVTIFLTHRNPHWLALLAAPEVLLLLGAVLMLLTSIRQDWHIKSVEYRLLAELYRAEKTLATLGWALSVGGVEHLADSEGLSWVAWLLAAMQRASPFPHCEVDSVGKTVYRVEELRGLLKEQIEYHEGNKQNAKRAAENLEKWGGFLFLSLAIVTFLQVPLLGWTGIWAHDGWKIAFAVLTGVLPSLSAAMLAIRSYAELQLVSEQSRTMEADLRRVRLRLERLDAKRPLASQLLGEEAFAVAAMILQELDGWGRIFRGKLLGTP